MIRPNGAVESVFDDQRRTKCRNQSSAAPSGRGYDVTYPGLKPRAESCYPFGLKSDSPLWDGASCWANSSPESFRGWLPSFCPCGTRPLSIIRIFPSLNRGFEKDRQLRIQLFQRGQILLCVLFSTQFYKEHTAIFIGSS
jgi:hypothetical protein